MDYLDASNAQLANPVKQLPGHLDLAFVVIYLLPLLCVGLCYNALAREKEVGTYALLRLYGLSDAQVIRLNWPVAPLPRQRCCACMRWHC